MAPWIGLAGGAIMLVSGSVWAASGEEVIGDAERGAGKIATCLACHGQDGNSLNAALGPKIAGQHPKYVQRQLVLFKNSGRQNAIMAPMAAGLSTQDIADLAAYYEAQTITPGVADDQLVTRGEKLYRAGTPQTGVPACMACHGPSGLGNPLAGYPKLAGQHTQYIMNTLTAFRDGTVWGTGDQANAVMAGVAKNLTDEEIQAVSSYIEGLHTAN